MNSVYFCHCTHLKSIGNQFEYCSGAWLVEKAKALDGFATDGSGFANTGDLANWKKVALATWKKTGVADRTIIRMLKRCCWAPKKN